MRVHTIGAAVLASLIVLLLPAGAAHGQRERLEATVGADYDEGDFGTSHTTRTLVSLFGIKYLGDRFDLGITASVDRIDGNGSVILINETPAGSEQTTRRRRVETRTGDVAIKGRFYVLDDPGPASFAPAISPVAKVSIPTSNTAHRNPDWTFGVELDKGIGRAGFFLLGEARYTIVGEKDVDDQPAASFGAGRDFSRLLSAWIEVDWRRAVVRGEQDAVELVGNLTYEVTRRFIMRPTVFVGLTKGAADFGAGIELAFRFGAFGPPTEETPERRIRGTTPRP